MHVCYNVLQDYLAILNYHLFLQQGFTDMAVRLVDGKLECRLTRPKSMEVYTGGPGYETYDLNNEYYLLLAWGSVYKSKITFYAFHIYLTFVEFSDKVIKCGLCFRLQLHALINS